MSVQKQLEQIAKSYDKAIEYGKKGIDLYDELPKHIKECPNYSLFQAMRTGGKESDSGRKEIKDFLSPDANMKFVDLGCCLNLMFRDYDKWPSLYYGVDISGETIKLLNEFVKSKNLTVGGLVCGSIHQTPFVSGFFDIGACIGVLEYFEKDFIIKALGEIRRILKTEAKFVLDVPDVGSPEFEIAKKVEAALERPDRYNMPHKEFEKVLLPFFEISKKEKTGAMVQYFLISKNNLPR